MRNLEKFIKTVEDVFIRVELIEADMKVLEEIVNTQDDIELVEKCKSILKILEEEDYIYFDFIVEVRVIAQKFSEEKRNRIIAEEDCNIPW